MLSNKTDRTLIASLKLELEDVCNCVEVHWKDNTLFHGI